MLLFGLSFLTVFIAKYLAFKLKNKKPMEKKEDPPKIYYVKKTVTEKKRKRSPKKANVALKGIVLTKEEFEKEKV